jgi:hypothetical protein
MYGLTNFLSVVWYSVMGQFGVGRERAHAVTLFNGSDETPSQALATDDPLDAERSSPAASLDVTSQDSDWWWRRDHANLISDPYEG